MLVVLSDLHFEEEASYHIIGDGSLPPIQFRRNLPAAPYRLLVAHLASEAVRNAVRKLEFVLAGDIFDLHRTGLWFTENPAGLRPYLSNDKVAPDLQALILRIVQGTADETYIRDVLPVFRLLANGRYEDASGKEKPFPIPVELHYIPGNHDRLANATPSIRQAIREALGLEAHGALFPNSLSFDEERALVRHGHEYDYTNFSVDLRHEESYPISPRSIIAIRPLAISPRWILPRACPSCSGSTTATARSWATRPCARSICACWNLTIYGR
jgi:hypothetical protein